MTVEEQVRRQRERMKAAAPYGIPAEAMATYDRGAALGAALAGERSARGFEAEVSQEVTRHLVEGGVRLQGGPHTVVMPPTAFFSSLGRDTSGGGQELMFERDGGVRGPLRPMPRVVQLGATVAAGTGDLRLTRVTDGLDPVWLPTDFLGDDQDLDEIALGSDVARIQTGMVSTVFSRTLDAQSGARSLLEADVDRAVAALVDQAALVGTGQDGQPLGLFNRTLSLAPSLGTDGGAPTWEWLCGIERTADEDARAPGLVTTKFVRDQLRQVSEGATGGPAWRGGPAPGFVLGAPAYVSGHVPANLTKGVGTDLSGLVFSSDWTNLVLRLAGIEIVADPYTYAAKGWVILRVFVYAGVGLWHTDPFVRADDVDAGSAS